MLYERDGTNDRINVMAAIDGFAEGFDLSNLSIDLDKIEEILRGMRESFPAQGGSDAASPFKKAANFLCYFIAERPVKNPFPDDVVGTTISCIANHQNVMIAPQRDLGVMFDQQVLHYKEVSMLFGNGQDLDDRRNSFLTGRDTETVSPE